MDLSAEVRIMIYGFLFEQPKNQILGLSREPRHNYANGPPEFWVAESRQIGLVYNSDIEREAPTNARFLRTCRLINAEATAVFYGANTIVLYAEDNNDIFYWLLDISEPNRRAIRHLEIGWAYGVEIESGRGNIHGIIERIAEMEESQEDEIQEQRDQLIKVCQKLEERTVRLIIRTLNLLVSNQNLISLAVYLPGIDAGDIWDVPNDNYYFAEEIFSNSTRDVHGCIPEAMRKMVGIKILTIGYTKDIELAEEIAHDAGAEELIIQVHPEGDTLGLNNEERKAWAAKGWRLEGAMAHKRLTRNGVARSKQTKEEDSEGGMLKNSMMQRHNTRDPHGCCVQHQTE
ncbi:hypothetical protein MMC26_006664 [Xylographa opegraphella]|nr:hypothetical protein [Xylographa opegraphella]